MLIQSPDNRKNVSPYIDLGCLESFYSSNINIAGLGLMCQSSDAFSHHTKSEYYLNQLLNMNGSQRWKR